MNHIVIVRDLCFETFISLQRRIFKNWFIIGYVLLNLYKTTGTIFSRWWDNIAPVLGGVANRSYPYTGYRKWTDQLGCCLFFFITLLWPFRWKRMSSLSQYKRTPVQFSPLFVFEMSWWGYDVESFRKPLLLPFLCVVVSSKAMWCGVDLVHKSHNLEYL